MDIQTFDLSRLPSMIPSRHVDGNKYTHGGVLIIAGSRGMNGAAALTAKSAMRSGAGIVYSIAAESIVLPLSIKLTEPVIISVAETEEGSIAQGIEPTIAPYRERCSAILIGPGLSRNSETAAMIRKQVLSATIPIVLDGDGLGVFSGVTDLLKPVNNLVITPHEGEWNRLFGPIAKEHSPRIQRVSEIAANLRITILLKGVPTIVADPLGNVTLIFAGNSGMATAGSGDVLAGIITALIAQGSEPTAAAIAGTAIHGIAGDFAAARFSEYAMIASDMVDSLGETFLSILNRTDSKTER